MNVTCWICGEPGTSGEHIIKKSDLKLFYGHVDQSRPIYLHRGKDRNQPVKGLESRLLKSPAKICSQCNNARSAPFDKAWARMSRYLYEQAADRKKLHRLDIKSIFGPTHRPPKVSARRMAEFAQLYFVKLWGTRLSEEAPHHQLLASLGEAVLRAQAHPDVYMSLKWDEDEYQTTILSCTDFHARMKGDVCEFMTWGYGLGRLLVQLYYAPERRLIRGGAWHPRDPGRFLSVKQGFG